MSLIRHFLADDSGATAIEYAMIIGTIGLAIVAGAAIFTSKFAAVCATLGAALS